MKIIKFNQSVLQDILKSFIESFPDWKLEDAKDYLMQSYSTNPDFCFMAVNENMETLGAIFCKTSPSKSGKILIIESIQVVKKHRNVGVGKSLLKHVIDECSKDNISNISMLKPVKKDFPISWYKKIGFSETGWVELEAKIDNIKNI